MILRFFKSSYCPVCEKRGVKFKPLPRLYEMNAVKYGYKYFGTGEMTALETYSYANCGASDRERLCAMYVKKCLNGGESYKILHFAPERSLSKFIRIFFVNSSYLSVDLYSDSADLNADLTNLNMIEDNTIDFFICSHVLEHILDDKIAIQELFRITKVGGFVILMVPISMAINKTIENVSNIDSDKNRWKYYGQNDHVRLYAKADFIDRITASGFYLTQYDANYFGSKIFKNTGLKQTSILYVVTK